MGDLLRTVVPLALGAAIAPTILTIELVTLGGKVAPRRRGWAIAVGYAAGLLAWAAVAVAFTRGVGGSGAEPEWTAVVRLVAAAGLAIAGVVTLVRNPPDKTPRQLALDRPALALFLGAGAVVMLTNLTTLALFLPAVHLIGVSGLGFADRAIAFGIVAAITMLPAIAPPLAVTIVGAPAERALAAMNGWLVRHRRAVGAAVCFGFAILLAVQGISELS